MTVGVILTVVGVQRNFSKRYLHSHASHVMKLMLRLPSNKYRMIFTVSDDTDTTAFLGFDMEVARLPNIQASQAAQIVGISVDA
ncbi:unnamed protein product [Brassica rapa subsp. trilocularis]